MDATAIAALSSAPVPAPSMPGPGVDPATAGLFDRALRRVDTPAAAAADGARAALGQAAPPPGPSGCDCGPMVRGAFDGAGITVPDSPAALVAVGRPVAADPTKVRAGDLIATGDAATRRAHVGIALSAVEFVTTLDGRILAAPIPWDDVRSVRRLG
jgi:cell wall-associated NlpC family hydrolase